MIKVQIITPRGLYKELETPIINISSVDGERGILPNHMPVVFALDIGKLETEENGKRQLYAISEGVFYFDDNKASILVSTIESKEDIDVKRAEASKERQLRRLEEKDENIDLKRAEVSLRRALNRIKIAG
ncbi:MAG: ATP synthase F1 subunit epsilon [Erysipelotrichaceae bacterium]|nr:ATP synthase F1 subunit epsilon [Erysipelotrichaceae bacterium]